MFNKIFEIQNLSSEFGINLDKIKDLQVLCLPEILTNAEFQDTEDIINLSKLLKSKGIKCSNSYDLDIKSKVIERRGSPLKIKGYATFLLNLSPARNSGYQL